MAKNKRKQTTYWLYGRHAVRAAVENSERTVRRVCHSGKQAPEWLPGSMKAEAMDAQNLERFVGRDAVHQGLIAEVEALASVHLEELNLSGRPVLILDQVTDPHNIGAILRSAAAFNVAAVMLPKDNAPGESAVMAKAACGALEMVPLVTVTNLSAAMQTLKDQGYWLIGMDGQAEYSVAEVSEFNPVALVFGAEGKGLRRLTRESCDRLVKIPINSQMESLNVSNAVAIACYLSKH